MNWYKSKIKIIPADTQFSILIRTRDKWLCKYKFKCYGGVSYEDNKGYLDCSHFQKRGKWSVRYDLENCDAACKKCHNFVENDPEGQKTLEAWKLKQLGPKRYKNLILRANMTGHRDDKLSLLYVKQLQRDLAAGKLEG